MSHLEKTLAALEAEHPGVIQEKIEFRGETTIVVAPDVVKAVLAFLKNTPELDYNYLADLAAVDYSPAEPRFAVSYIPYSLRYNTRFRVKTFAADSYEPELDTVSDLYLSANWQEREAYDMMGISFTGHPDQRRILMPADWEGHPHRKDYPLGYEEVQFSFNRRDVDKRKNYAKRS